MLKSESHRPNGLHRYVAAQSLYESLFARLAAFLTIEDQADATTRALCTLLFHCNNTSKFKATCEAAVCIIGTVLPFHPELQFR